MRLLLIDISAVFWPQWHAGDGGEGIEARNKTVKRCIALAQRYDRAAICVDAGDSGRSEILPEYKANRPPKPAPAVEQLKRAIVELSKRGLHVLKADGYEADDVIATACSWAHEIDAVESVTVACADKDLLQLVGGKVDVYSLSTDTQLDVEGVVGKFGIEPHQIPDWLGLVGDTADNIPGCPGVGAKSATEYLQKYLTLEGVLNAAGDKLINGKRGESLLENAELIERSRKLAELIHDVPLELEKLMNEPKQEEPEEQEPIDVEVTESKDPQTAKAVVIRSDVPFARQLEPASPDEAIAMAKYAIASNAFTHYPTGPAAYLAIIAGRERGLGAVASLRGHFVFDGHLGMFTQLMVAEVLRSGKAEYFRPVLSKCNETTATWETKRKGEDTHHEFTFTMEMAKKRGLDRRPNYQKQPDTMLRHRCAAELARAIYPDVVGGVYTEADLGDRVMEDLLP